MEWTTRGVKLMHTSTLPLFLFPGFLLSSCYPWPQIWESKDCCPSVVLLLNAPIIHTTRRTPPNTLISHCAYQWSRYTLLHCQLRQWKAKVVVLSKGIEKTKLVPTLSVMTPREFIELLQQGAVSTQREAASLLSSSALQFMLQVVLQAWWHRDYLLNYWNSLGWKTVEFSNTAGCSTLCCLLSGPFIIPRFED